jgi:hypothetical protein
MIRCQTNQSNEYLQGNSSVQCVIEDYLFEKCHGIECTSSNVL